MADDNGGIMEHTESSMRKGATSVYNWAKEQWEYTKSKVPAVKALEEQKKRVETGKGKPPKSEIGTGSK